MLPRRNQESRWARLFRQQSNMTEDVPFLSDYFENVVAEAFSQQQFERERRPSMRSGRTIHPSHGRSMRSPASPIMPSFFEIGPVVERRPLFTSESAPTSPETEFSAATVPRTSFWPTNTTDALNMLSEIIGLETSSDAPQPATIDSSSHDEEIESETPDKGYAIGKSDLKSSDQEDSPGENVCGVCWEPLDAEKAVFENSEEAKHVAEDHAVLRSCGHLFCAECLKDSSQWNCAICREVCRPQPLQEMIPEEMRIAFNVASPFIYSFTQNTYT